VARREVEPRSRFVDYLLYVSFFPQLMAGPIERAGHLLPQIERARTWSWSGFRSGLALALWGGFKKLAIADSLAPYVDKVYVLDSPSGPLLWAATAGFMVQLFADFSGYTDIARGTARMLGFDLVENFREPFLARTTIQFWQRWHMSLSSWIRDYLLGPLVGDRGASRFRFAVATIVTFVVIGLWHGPSWNYVLFGLYHGVWVVTYGLLVRRLPAWTSRIPAGGAFAVSFHLVAVGLVGSMLFREQHLDRIARHLGQHPFAAPRAEWIATAVVVGVTAAGAAILVAQWALTKFVAPRFEDRPWWLPVQTTVWAMLVVGMFLFYRTTLQDFVYFQF
jgi:D-alanyl-lipoteichoic acid acyltransferase DltB (MBOAT superfamily)